MYRMEMQARREEWAWRPCLGSILRSHGRRVRAGETPRLEALGTHAEDAGSEGDSGLTREHQRVMDALNVMYARAWTATADDRPSHGTSDALRLSMLEREAEALRDRMSALAYRTLDVVEPISLDGARRSLAPGAGVALWFVEGPHAGVMLVDHCSTEARLALVPVTAVERTLSRLSCSLRGLACDDGSARDRALWHAQLASPPTR